MHVGLILSPAGTGTFSQDMDEHDGDYAQKIISTDSALIHQDIPLVSGSLYKFSAWVKITAACTQPVYICDATQGVFIADIPGTAVGDYTLLTGYLTANSTRNHDIQIGMLAGAGTYLIDDVSVKEIIGGDAIVHGQITGGGTSGIKVLVNGNTGIGVTDPQTTLHTKGGSGTDDGTEHTGLILQGTSYGEDAGSQLQFDIGDGSNGAGYGAAIAAVDEGGYDTRLEFRTKNSGSHSNTLCTASDTKMSIDAEGAVGIATTAPNTKLDLNGDFALRENSPAQITANQDDYAVGSYSVLRLTSSTGSFNITGFAGGVQGKFLYIINVNDYGSNRNLILKHNQTSSTANRIYTQNEGDLALAPAGVALLWYDSTSARWRVLK